MASQVSKRPSMATKHEPGSYVFGLCKDDQNWYAAVVESVDNISGRYHLVWCEDHSLVTLTESFIKAPKDILQKWLHVHFIAKKDQQFYTEAVFREYKEDGIHLCKTLENSPVFVHVKKIMVRDSSLDELKKKLKQLQLKRKAAEENAAESAKKSAAVSAVPTTESETISAKSPEVASMKVPEKPFAKISPVVATKKVPAETLDEEPEPGAKPLEQHFFLLTQGAKRWRYDRDDLTVKIKKLGGTVCDTFAEIFETFGQKFLIAPEPLRTVKYIQCLTAGIPCVSEDWIQEVFVTRRRTDFQRLLLIAGFSRKGESVKWTPREQGIFEGQSVALYGDSWFNDVYKGALRGAKATPVIVEDDDISAGTDISACMAVVVDECKPDTWKNIVELCKDHSVPLVGSEWLIQCAIHGQALELDDNIVTGSEPVIKN